MIKAVLFDMDGVLLDSYNMWLHTFRFALKEYMDKEISKKEFDDNVWSRSFKLIAQEHFKGKEKFMMENYFGISEQFFSQIKVFPVEDVLKKLKQKKLVLGVFSNTFTKTVKGMLKQAKFLDYFEIVIGGDMVKNAKPDPEGINYFMDVMGFSKEEIIFVGDHKYDMMAGSKAGVYTVGLNVNGGDKRISSLKELLEIV